ncbi:MAG TPA: hypothetical protein VF952_18230 [Chloroflexia bacterium]|jgi:hypothetical protein
MADYRGTKSMMSVLVEAITYLSASIEFSDGEDVHPDWASKVLESLVTILQTLTFDERNEFKKCLQEIVEHEVVQQQQMAPFYDPHYHRYLQFLTNFMTAFDLEDDEEET